MHIPVLKDELLEYLNPKPGQNYIDCTAGEGGHTIAIAKKILPGGRVLAIDRERRNKEKINQLGIENVVAVEGSYLDVEEIIEKEGFGKVSGIVLDLGFSSWHIDESGRGFSFTKDEPLIMKYGEEEGLTAWEIVNSWPKEEIVWILKEYGEERFAERIVEKIISCRKVKKIESSLELAEVIRGVVPKRGKIDPATKSFQALRIAVNDELESLRKILPISVNLLMVGGKLAVISFHSLEDRIVKHFFRESEELKIETKKPLVPSEDEVIKNRRARSAKLRIATRVR